MKPIVIYVDKQKNNITLTREEFEDFINKAYEQGYSCGYADGKKDYWPSHITYTSSGSNTPITINPNPVSPFTYDTQITCDAHNDIGETKCAN
jgi:hypothetical protein